MEASLALGTLPIFERIPLGDVLQLYQTDKSFHQRRAALISDVALLNRVEREEPVLLLGLLRHTATAYSVDEHLREACIRRLQWRKTISVGMWHALALLDDGSTFISVRWGKRN